MDQGKTVLNIDWRAELETASSETGLKDYGGDGFHAGLAAYADAVNHDRRLPEAGRQGARATIRGTLAKRLQVYRDRALYPEIAHQRIVRPLIVIGMPRSGTTFFHALLSQDPRARSPLAWEWDAPSPPPRTETHETDPRIAATQARMDLTDPEFLRMHLIGARLPEECNALTTLAFQSSNFSAGFDIPSYVDWYLRTDDAAPYAAHKHFLQHLQAFAPKSWWVLKSPPHMFHIQRLFETYPDACMVFPHRDPAATLPSLASLISYIRRGNYGSIDETKVGPEMADYWRTAFDRTMAYRAQPGNERKFVDVHYNQMVREPLKAVQVVYDHFGIEFTDEARGSMQAFLDNQPKDKHGAHTYTLEQFGLSKGRIHDEYAAYLDKYGVARV